MEILWNENLSLEIFLTKISKKTENYERSENERLLIIMECQQYQTSILK